ncbi:MAG TPA: MopE-related protein [Myxococcota bacterium]|jgi:hypothetical protein|nr:MopE-related protein [Myxococcota bacterium]
MRRGRTHIAPAPPVALAFALGLLSALAVAGCAPRTGVAVQVMLGLGCMDQTSPAIVELRAEVLPCTDDPLAPVGYACTVTSPDGLVDLVDDRFPVSTAELMRPDGVAVLVQDLSAIANAGVDRIRIALSAVDAAGALVAFGALDAVVEPGVIVQQADPLVLWTTCGAPAGADYDGDGAVGDVDCAPFDPTRIGNLPEVCENGIDEDCYLGDAPCELPMGNPADIDGDSYCAIGAEVRYADEPDVLSVCSVHGFTDCDDLDPSVLDICRCTDLDGDGWCAEPAACAHDGTVVCNPMGGDCCDGGPGDWGCPPSYGAAEINPGQPEQCDAVDHDCSGQAWDLLVSPCYAEGAAAGVCATGLLCDAAPVDGSYACVVPEGAAAAPDAALCGGAGASAPPACLECPPVGGWDVELGAPCSDAGVSAAGFEAPVPQAAMDCTWEVVLPTYPLVVYDAGSDCLTARYGVDYSAVAGPGTYAVYLRYTDVYTGAVQVMLVLLPLEAGVCGATGVSTPCEVGSGTTGPCAAF